MNQYAAEQTVITVFDLLECSKDSNFIVLCRVQKESFLFKIKALRYIFAGIFYII